MLSAVVRCWPFLSLLLLLCPANASAFLTTPILLARTKPSSSSGTSRPMSTTESVPDKLQKLGLTLPPPPPAKANYVPCVQVGNLLYLSGHLPTNADGTLHTGACRSSDDVPRGYAAAQAVALNLLATIGAHVQGDWSRVKGVVKLFGIVNSADDFREQHLVLNGASDLLVQVFDGCVHARSAIGTNTLPLDITVEIEAIVQLRE